MDDEKIIASKDVEGLIKALDQEDELLACHAAESLGRIRDNKCIPALLEAIASGREWLSQEAGKAVGQLAGQDSLKDIANLCETKIVTYAVELYRLLPV